MEVVVGKGLQASDQVPEFQATHFDLPGYTLPPEWVPRDSSMFPNALHYQPDSDGGDAILPMLTLCEITMLKIMNAITDKPGWEKKVFDDAIVQKWTEESLDDDEHNVTPAMMKYVINELRWRAEDFAKSKISFVFNGDVVKSDHAVPESLKLELQNAVRVLEDVPEAQKDWHPGSDGKVLDLVHPSLFPLVYGFSRILPDQLVTLNNCKSMVGRGDVLKRQVDGDVAENPNESSRPPRKLLSSVVYSDKFQWLPCNVDFQAASTLDEPRLRITSYINNLDPYKHGNLYTVIERILEKTIPLWERTLTSLQDEHFYKRVKFSEVTYDPDPEDMSEDEQERLWGDYDNDDRDDNERNWREEHLVHPDAGDFAPPTSGPLSSRPLLRLQNDFGKTGLQVIVKLANIELTPDKPTYDGGSWHIEGQLNEHICASALYYYSSTNISPSHLSFRHLVPVSYDDLDIYYPQNDHAWLPSIFGLEDGHIDGAVQDAGAVQCKEGRLVTFPNVLMHRVEPFSLADTTKPGSRKILALFLVDPHIRIISSANVPPQRRDWWWHEHVLKDPRNPIAKRLPRELQENVYRLVDDDAFPMSRACAEELRRELMDERSSFVESKGEEFGERQFNLCEH